MLMYKGKVKTYSISDLFGCRKVAQMKVKPFLNRLEEKDYQEVIGELDEYIDEEGEIVIYTKLEHDAIGDEDVFLIIAKEVKIDE